ncbi:hypothetical protein EG329_008743 [Mollisiaceae sp. DMI_Dod_QoI]|nr:hypothetical protein EG329_008743 [Helotiales sp. DMI_Dod_QoI]
MKSESLLNSGKSLVPRKVIKAPMPGTPCSVYGCRKDDIGVCVSCGRIRPWLERPPGYPIGAKAHATKNMDRIKELLMEVDETIGLSERQLEEDKKIDEVRAGFEKL